MINQFPHTLFPLPSRATHPKRSQEEQVQTAQFKDAAKQKKNANAPQQLLSIPSDYKAKLRVYARQKRSQEGNTQMGNTSR